jgi:hypothetical protein
LFESLSTERRGNRVPPSVRSSATLGDQYSPFSTKEGRNVLNISPSSVAIQRSRILLERFAFHVNAINVELSMGFN